ncbi:MAG: thioredoxin domain-containing protein [Terriglobales bacterium]
MSTETLNSLANAASPYLRSAMHQPIRWHEWSEEAFAAAKGENKPVLLDIGAVWCHWCHVMDRESYESAEIAQIINERFIAIKVDRDERPDVDARYQAAVQAMTGQGGWPLTAFLTPEGKPFFGGTYFPPVDHYGRPSFQRVLLSISEAFANKKDEVTEQGEMVLRAISQGESFSGQGAPVPPTIVSDIVSSAVRMFDTEHGGFGAAPKFPHPSALDLLMHEYARSRDEKLRDVIVTTLAKMAQGGVYDQLAGGFHRYSVDERWVVPHFEKMSYDNSELLKNYAHGYQVTGESYFAMVAKDIIRWMDELLSDREHSGFYASQDADISLDDDGDHFTWSLQEAQQALSEPEFKVAQLYYDIYEVGEMQHDPTRNVLHVRATIDDIGVRLGMQHDRVAAVLESAKRKMLEARMKRPMPFVDRTVYTGWNGLCISAYLAAARVLHLPEARDFALKSLDRVLSEAWKGKSLAHVIAYSEKSVGARIVPGVLDDYAFLVLAALDGYETTADIRYFEKAHAIADAMIERFHDRENGGFFDAPDSPIAALSARRKPFQDSPTPAGNSAAAIALLRLYAYTNNDSYRDIGEKTLRVFAGVAGQYGMFAATYGLACAHLLEGHTQVVVIGKDAAADELYLAAIAPYSATKSVLRLRDAAALVSLPPALAETLPNVPGVRDGRSLGIVCSGFTCQPPVREVRALREALGDSNK